MLPQLGPSLVIILNLIGCCLGQANENAKWDNSMQYDPNRLLNGFFPAWSMLLLAMAGK